MPTQLKNPVSLQLPETEAQRPVVWSIAGSDSAACAGIQADLLTFEDLGARGCTAVTAVTAQSENAVDAVYPVSVEQLAQQLDTLSQAHKPRAIKLGLLGNAELALFLKKYLARWSAPIIFDPVLRASVGTELYDSEGVQAQRDLLELCAVVTPNIPEAEILSGHKIKGAEDMVRAAHKLRDMGASSVLIKGGHGEFDSHQCWDYWTDSSAGFWLCNKRIGGSYRGSGCSLAAALAAALVSDWNTSTDERQILCDALVMAKAYVQHGIRRARDMNTAVLAHGRVALLVDDLPRIYQDYGEGTSTAIAAWSDPMPGLYPVVDSSAWVNDLATQGVDTIQLRIKTQENGDTNRSVLEDEISAAQKLATEQGARLIVNDYWQLAIKHKSYGVHLGQSDLAHADLQAIAESGLRLGLSVHSWWELARALTVQPSYIALGPVYETSSKEMSYRPIGTERLRLWHALIQAKYPCVAIGGISADNAPSVWASGVEGIALISAIVDSENWQQAVRELQAPEAH